MQLSVLTPYCPKQSVMQLSLLIDQNSGAAQTPDTLLSKTLGDAAQCLEIRLSQKSVMQLSVLTPCCPKQSAIQLILVPKTVSDAAQFPDTPSPRTVLLIAIAPKHRQ